MASKISKEMTVMKRGIGEKLASVFQSIVSFFLSVALGFYWGPILAGIIFATLPALAILAGLIGAVFNTGSVEAMKAYAQSAGYAEQALQSIKVVHTYCQEALELKNYSKNLDEFVYFEYESFLFCL